jgi:hypothetical protein
MRSSAATCAGMSWVSLRLHAKGSASNLHLQGHRHKACALDGTQPIAQERRQLCCHSQRQEGLPSAKGTAPARAPGRVCVCVSTATENTC